MAIAHPYLMFLGEAADPLAAKTAQGIVHWRPEWCPGAVDRVRVVHDNAPNSRLIVDANEAWTPDIFADLVAKMKDLGVELIEQPFHQSADESLAGLALPVSVYADESCDDRASLAQLAGRYDAINIKLDKTGGLTEALALKEAGHAAGYGLIVGCMLGTSLAMAPALLLAQDAAFVDLDGPLLLARDRTPGFLYTESQVAPAERALWG